MLGTLAATWSVPLDSERHRGTSEKAEVRDGESSAQEVLCDTWVKLRLDQMHPNLPGSWEISLS